MLDKKVVELLNQQVNKEFYSAYLYLDFSNFYYDKGLDGFGNWYKIQAQEERDHAMLMLQYLQNNGERAVLEAIDKPAVEITDAKLVLEAGLQHEQYVTGLIHTIYDAAHSVKDFRTMQFLDWFVKEQGEEENNAETLEKKFELFGNDPKSLYMLDNELGRVPIPHLPWYCSREPPKGDMPLLSGDRRGCGGCCGAGGFFIQRGEKDHQSREG